MNPQSNGLNQVVKGYPSPPTCVDNAVSRVSHVQQTLGNLHNATCSLDTVIEQLFKRLDTVIRHEPSNPEKCIETPKQCLVDIACKIDEQADKVHTLVSRLNYLLERIET